VSQKRAREARRQAGAAKTQPTGRSPRAWILIAAAGAAVVAVLVAGVLVARGTGPAQAVSASSSSAVSISGTDPVTGKNVSLADYAGKPVVLNVWGSWCEGCIAEAEDLQRFVERHPEAQMIGIDYQDSADGARRFYAEHGWKHPSIDDPHGEISKGLGLQGTPTTFFLDSSHRVVTRIVGATDEAGFEQGLAAAVAAS
jgi:thiol-disulfide isomerase/thioredoxin